MDTRLGGLRIEAWKRCGLSRKVFEGGVSECMPGEWVDRRQSYSVFLPSVTQDQCSTYLSSLFFPPALHFHAKLSPQDP